MKQDLFDWLNSTHTSNTYDEGTAENLNPPLLLAPVSGELHDAPPEPEASESVAAQHEPELPEPEAPAISEPLTYDHESPAISEPLPSEPESPAISEPLTYEPETPAISEPLPSEPESPAMPEPDNFTEDFNAETEAASYPDEQHTSILNQAWHEAAAFTINLNEPPQEMWTDINSDDDDEPKDYEENMSLQGDAYIPVVRHGANFTQRLQATLQGRKAKAAKRRELDAENENHHPYFQKAVIFCGVLLMALGFAYFGLWFIQRETPDGINNRAVKLYEQGKFDEAENLYHRGYNRYPHVLGFLTGMARSAEKAGHTQTAIAAWNEYVSLLPKDDTEHRTTAQEELDRLIPGHPHKNSQALPQKTQTPIPAKLVMPQLPNVRALTFEEALKEANNAYNIGMFSRAIANFHKANAISQSDIRPYIGLAASYRARGLYFEAKRMLDEARHKFGINPTIDVERYFLRRE